MKTARFTDLVKKAGAPNPYLLWVSPKKDDVFQRAVKEQRVLTIHQENVGTKKDYGMVGFHEEPNAQYLVFPKSLKAFGERRIIGINYDLLAKESRAGKTPEIQRRSPPANPPKKEALKPAAQKAKADESREPEEKVVAFEAPVKESAPDQERPAKTTSAAKSTKPAKQPKPLKASKSRPQEKPTKPAKPTPPEKRPTHESAVDPRVLSVVRRVMKDLDAGKTVAAYKKLEALVAEAENADG